MQLHQVSIYISTCAYLSIQSIYLPTVGYQAVFDDVRADSGVDVVVVHKELGEHPCHRLFPVFRTLVCEYSDVSLSGSSHVCGVWLFNMMG
jgi:hypothetical protein